MSKTHSYAEIASSFQLWQEFVDPNGATTRHEFDSMTTADRIAAQIEAFGPEPEAVPSERATIDGTGLLWARAFEGPTPRNCDTHWTYL